MGRNHEKSAFWAEWALISYTISGNCQFHTKTSLFLCCKRISFVPLAFQRNVMSPSSPQFPGQATRKAIRRSRRTCSNMAPNHHKTLLAQTTGQMPIRPQRQFNLMRRVVWWRRKPVWEGGKRECLSKQKEGTIILNQLLVSFV